MRVYLAGKIRHGDWRTGLSYEVANTFMSGEPLPAKFPVVPLGIGDHEMTGPYFLSCDHSCYHQPNGHGLGATELGTWGDGGEPWESTKPPTRDNVVEMCLDAIRRSDVVFSWIDDPSCYGTLAEIGYARGVGREVWVAGTEPFDDLWFAYHAADRCLFWYEEPRTALAAMLSPDPAFRRIKRMPGLSGEDAMTAGPGRVY